MSALDELRMQVVGEEFLALLQRTISAVARAGLYPPPTGREHWDGDSVSSTAADFLASPQTPRRLADLRTHCRTEAALKARLQRTIKNFLADNGRRTTVGRLVRRFNEVLTQDSAFERDGVYWRLTGTLAEPSVFDFERLVHVVADVEASPPAAWHKGDRNSPAIDKPSVLRVARAALDAGGPLRPGELARLAARRLGLDATPLSLEASAYEPAPPDHRSWDTTGVDSLVELRAAEVLSRLNEPQRLTIGLRQLSSDALGEVLGFSGSKANKIQRSAVAIIRDELETEEDGQVIADALFDLASEWSEMWMTQDDPT